MDKTELEAPGEITHLGWHKSLHYAYTPHYEYFIEWSYVCPCGTHYSLRNAAADEAMEAAGQTPAKMEEELVKLVNNLYRSNQLNFYRSNQLFTCGCFTPN